MKISVIIPVYNAEKYLQRCIFSVINQTYTDWELVLVDDGSTDNSLSICKENAERDKRIKVIHQSNKGPGIARNIGLEAITGDYVVFVDADDFVDSEYFSLLQEKAEDKDVVFIDVQQVRVDGAFAKKEYMSVYENSTMDDMVRATMTGFFPWGGVRKVASATLIKKNNIRYSDARIGEEAVFTFRVLSCAKTFGFIDDKAVYFYELHEESQSSILVDDPWGNTFCQMRDCLKQNNVYETYANTLNALNLMASVLSISNIALKYPFRECYRKAKERAHRYNNDLDKLYLIDKSHLPFKAKIWIPLINLSIVLPLIIASRIRHWLR